MYKLLDCSKDFGTLDSEKWKVHLKSDDERACRTFFIDDVLGNEPNPWLCTVNYYHEKELLCVLYPTLAQLSLVSYSIQG